MIDQTTLTIQSQAESGLDRGYFRLQCGDRWEENLTRDEALFVVAVWLASGVDQPPYLKNANEHFQQEAFFDDIRRRNKKEDAAELIVI